MSPRNFPSPRGKSHSLSGLTVAQIATLARRVSLLTVALTFLAAFLLEPSVAVAGGQKGLPPVELHNPGKAGFGESCLSSSPGPDGSLYVGSPNGVLEFDGSSWRLIHTPGRTQVRSLLVLEDGRIAWGGVNEFGLLAPDARRDWGMESLSDSLNQAGVHFREVRSIHQLAHGLYFQCAEFLARWHRGHLQLWLPGGTVGGAEVVDGQLYVQAEGRGLLRLREERLPAGGTQIPDGALEAVLGPELFQDGNRMVCLLPLEKGLLLGTRQMGLFRLEKGQVEPLNTGLDFTPDAQLFHGLRLKDGRLALATLRDGLFVLDASARTLLHLGKAEGLPGNQVLHVNQDAIGDLWLSSMDGLCRVGLARPFTRHGEVTGLQGRMLSLARHNGTLFVGSTQGLFRLEEAKGAQQVARFTRTSLEGICWALTSTPDALLAIVGPSLFEVGPKGQRAVLEGQPTCMALDPAQADRGLVGVEGKVRQLRRRAAGWEAGDFIPGLSCNASSMVCSKQGLWWLGTSDMGLIRLQERHGRWEQRQYGSAQGLPAGGVEVSLLGDRVLALSEGHCFEIEGDCLRSCDRFLPPDGWSEKEISSLTQSRQRLWGIFRDGLARAPALEAGELKWTPLLHVHDGIQLGPLLVEDSGVWVCKGRELLLLDPDSEGGRVASLPLRLRSLLLGGREWAGSAGGLRGNELPQGRGPLEVEVVSAGGDWDGLQLWSWRLEGLDEEWSPWSQDAHLRLPWLPGGDYTLQVRHRLGDGPITQLNLARLNIPLPWHAHWWLRTLALLVAAAFMHTVARLRAQRLKEHNARLQAEVQERHNAEAALALREAHYRSLFEHAMDGILILDMEGRVQQANPAALRMFQLQEEQLKGQSPVQHAPLRQADGRESSQVMADVLARVSRGEAQALEWLHCQPAGGQQVLDVELSPLEAGGGNQILAVVRDLSERRELEEKLRQSQKLEAVGRLAGGIAHDFNNILMVIQGQCDILLMGPHGRLPEDPLREDLNQIRDAARRAADLTRQLLAFSRKQTLHPQQVSLNRALGDVERMLRRVLGEHIHIQLNLDAELHAVSVDPGQLDQVVVNLAVNARDAMPGGGRLEVTTSNEELDEIRARELGLAPGPHVRLDMRDTGHGMDAPTLAHIFEPFYTTKEPGKGTGLGLATVYGIIAQSGGAIRVESQVGEGSVFQIHLPAARNGQEATAIHEQAGLDELGGRERILLVEDESAVREVLQRTLENHGYQVLVAEEGQRALDLLLGGEDVDLVLSDMVMPQLGGMELAQALRTLGRTTPMVLMSGYTDHPLDEPVCQELKLGVLMKPFGPRALLTELRTRLEPGIGA